MESMGKKPRRRRSFTPEFKAEIVELRQRGDRSAGQVAKDFDLTETAVREWVKQAERDPGTRQDGGLTSAERRELAELRRENRRLREDVDILKRVALLQRRLVQRLIPLTGLRIMPCLFTAGALVEAIWWHPINDGDPEHAYLRDAVGRACASVT
jgi:transposase